MMNSKELVCSLSTLNLEGELVSRMLAERAERRSLRPPHTLASAADHDQELVVDWSGLVFRWIRRGDDVVLFDVLGNDRRLDGVSAAGNPVASALRR